MAVRPAAGADRGGASEFLARRAAELAGTVAAHPHANALQRVEAERQYADLAAALPEDARVAAYDRGRAWELDHVIMEIIAELEIVN